MFKNYLIIGSGVFIFEAFIFILNIIIYYKLKAEEKKRKQERREARKLRTLSNKVDSQGVVEDKDVGEFVCMMIDTAKLAPRNF